jgi:hypothetical protein
MSFHVNTDFLLNNSFTDLSSNIISELVLASNLDALYHPITALQHPSLIYSVVTNLGSYETRSQAASKRSL